MQGARHANKEELQKVVGVRAICLKFVFAYLPCPVEYESALSAVLIKAFILDRVQIFLQANNIFARIVPLRLEVTY